MQTQEKLNELDNDNKTFTYKNMKNLNHFQYTFMETIDLIDYKNGGTGFKWSGVIYNNLLASAQEFAKSGSADPIYEAYENYEKESAELLTSAGLCKRLLGI